MKNLHHFFQCDFLGGKIVATQNQCQNWVFVCWVLWNRKKRQSRHLAVMSTRNLRFRHVAIWRDPFLGGWPWTLGPGDGVFVGGLGLIRGKNDKMIGGHVSQDHGLYRICFF